MPEDEISSKRRSAAFKLAKEGKKFDPTLSEEVLDVYIEQITEEVKQISRDLRKLAALVPKEIVVPVDGEDTVAPTLMRRWANRLKWASENIAHAATFDFEQWEKEQIEIVLEEDEDEDDADEG